VSINSKFKTEDHIHDKVRNMYILLGNMKVAFKYIDEDMGQTYLYNLKSQYLSTQQWLESTSKQNI